ncbi:MAG: MHYT domain-containing protein [Telluria sp.]
MLSIFTIPDDPTLLSYGQYDLKLVLLSLLVAIFSSWMGLQIAGQARDNRAQRTIVLATGSLALGAGVWAMHFIGMLAFDLCTRVEYDPLATIASALPSIGASFVALSLIARDRIGGWTLLAGGVLVGAGIGAMHYSGMAGMRMSLELRYEPIMFGLSILVAVVLATLALWVRFGLADLGRLDQPRLLLAAAVVMGCAIAGMHYTGMAAARFVGAVPAGAAGSSNSSFLALAISLITVAFTIFVLAANGLLRYRQIYLELLRSQAWSRAMLTTTIDGVITIDRSGVIREFNASAEQILGWTRDEVAGRNIRMLVGDHELTESSGLPAFLRTGAGSGAPKGAEVMALRRDGSLVPVRYSLGHAKMGAHDVYVCFVTDISERRAMMQALSASERQFRSLIGNIPGISYRSLLDGDYPMLFISDAAERITGYAPADFMGTKPRRTFGSLIHAADRALVWDAVQQAVRGDRPYLVEYRLLHADGSIRWLWENGTCVRNDAGEVTWLDGVILDISERREMEEALRSAKETAEQAAAARATFVANMSHEIRTPMNSILGFTDVLLDGELAPAQRRHLDTVRSAGRSLLRLLNEILDTAKLEKGAVELDLHDFNLLSLIDELSSTLGAAARAKGLHVDIHYDPALPASIHGDELRLRQVLTNLLDNAIKFTPRGGVTLCAAAVCDQLHIEVRDTGIGIAPERLAAIFDPFTQADASMTRRFGGTGLGTTISKQLVELMKGRIWAESVPGEGTTFHVLLPLSAARFAPQQPRARTAAVLPPMRVLVADDVPQNLELLALLLERRGHTVTAAADGAVAIELAARHDFDLVLMDFQMPVVDGLAATRAIRAQARAARRPRVPIVAMTASVLAEHRRASVEAGMDGFASKPVDWYALSHEIARVLGVGQGVAEPAAPEQRQVLNRHAGLRRWAGNSDAYSDALDNFRHEYAQLATTLLAHAAGGDWNALRMLAHRARGTAANIGLEQLAAALAQLEQAAGHDRAAVDAAVAGAMPQTAEAIGAALGAIRPGRPNPAAVVPDKAAADIERARREGGQLLQALRRGALDDDALSGLVGALADHPAADTLERLQAALADFDFTLAQQQLQAMLAALDDPMHKEAP